MNGDPHEVEPIAKPTKREKAPRRGLPREGKKAKRDRREMIDAKAQVLVRSRGRCEARDWPHDCDGLASQFHHVKRRSQGGTNDPENLLYLCATAHLRVHAFPEEARAAGLLA